MFSELRCPNKTCYGWVSEVEESSNNTSFGCGSCGSVWFSYEGLQGAISNICKQYSYRKNVYSNVPQGFIAVDIDDEPEDYEENVVKEWDDV